MTQQRGKNGWAHSHDFGQARKRTGEARTLAVTLLTSAMMVVEVAAGLVYGSMALLADGLHMGSHAVALGISVFAYVYARRHAHDQRFNFGTGKVNALGGFAGAILLPLFAIAMALESCSRFFSPVPIAFDQAIWVAVVGLIVNGISALILGNGHEHSSEHDAHTHQHQHGDEHTHRHDHNLWAAYLHVIADALTSVLAIGALVSGKWLGWTWMDPVMGIVGAVVILVWSKGLLQATARVLLDMQAAEHVRAAIRHALEDGPGDKIADLHVWTIAPGLYAACICVVSPSPRPAQYYREKIAAAPELAHITVEVQQAHPEEVTW